MSNGELPECPAGSCGYGAFQGNGHCNPGDGSCANARLVIKDNPTPYHTDAIMEASGQINDIFKGLGEDPRGIGRKLSLLRTPRGVAVGWVHHNVETAPDRKLVGADDPRVINELMIDDIGADGEMCAGKRCSFEILNDEVVCFEHYEPTCWVASFLEARESDYHPKAVREAVIRIKDIVARLAYEAGDRKLSLLSTADGMMLAWTQHSDEKAQQAA